jgi:DNA-binding NtrC family response regulator
MILLSVESDNGAVLTYRLAKPTISVGASSRSDVVIRASGVGDRHLVIHRNGDVFTFVTSERQTVVLNGERRSRGVLNPGDKVRVGAATLVFRGQDGDEGGPGAEVPLPEAKATRPERDGAEAVVFRPDPAGFGEARARLVEVFSRSLPDRLQQVVDIVHEALPEIEIALLVPTESENPVALTSIWAGELPRLPRRTIDDFAVPGRYALLTEGGASIVAVPAITPEREVAAVFAARPLGALGAEGIALLGEIGRMIGLHWREVESEDRSFLGWELEAKQRLDVLLPGTSQAMQVLRTGLLAAAQGHEPVLICGGEGVGRTEAARILATLGPVGGRPVVLLSPGESELENARLELFGPAGLPPLSADAGGAVAHARGGLLVLRDVEDAPPALQAELATLIAAQQRETATGTSVRWVVTCGEDPLALVQKGKLSSPLFMVFSKRMLRVPRLAERREDLPLLIAALLRRVAAEQGKSLRGISLECLNVLLSREFPGEMAELVGEVNRLVTATPDGEMVRCEAMGPVVSMTPSGDSNAELIELLSSDNLKQIIPRLEQLLIDRVMRRVKGNQSRGSRILGISRGALIAKLKEYGIPDYRFLRRRRS